MCTPCVVQTAAQHVSRAQIVEPRCPPRAPTLSFPLPRDEPLLTSLTPNSSFKDAEDELNRAHVFLLEFADRLQCISGKPCNVKSYTLSPRARLRNRPPGSTMPADMEQGFAMCEASFSAIADAIHQNARMEKTIEAQKQHVSRYKDAFVTFEERLSALERRMGVDALDETHGDCDEDVIQRCLASIARLEEYAAAAEKMRSAEEAD